MSAGADLNYTLGLEDVSFNSTAQAATKTATGLGSVLAGLGATAFGASMLRRGFEFNQTMYDGEKAVQAIVQQFQGLDAAAAKGVAASAMRQLVDLEPKVAGSLKDLVGGFSATAASSLSVGLSVEQNIDLVGKFANALGKLALPIDQVGQELRSILTGNIGADSQLAKTLGITNEMVDAARKAGTLYELLTSKVGQLGEAGDNAATAFSSLSSAIDKALGAVSQGLFQAAITNAGNLSAAVDENRAGFETLGEAIGMVAGEVVKIGGFIYEATSQAARLAAIAAMMVQDGLSYGEAAKLIDDAAEARKRDTEAAKAQAAAVAKVSKAAAPMETTAKSKPEAKSKAGASKGGGGDPFAETERQTEAEARLAEMKRRAAMEEMSTGQKLGVLHAELNALAEEEQTLRSDPFGGSKDRLIEVEMKRVELQREINQLKRQEANETQRAASAAQRESSSSSIPAASENGRSGRIGGVRARRLMGSPGGGGIDQFRRDQVEDSAFERLQKQPFGADALSTRAVKRIGGTAKTADRVSRLMGEQDPRSLSDRAASTLGPPAPKPDGGPQQQQQDPTIAKLDAILGELTRIRTT